MKKIYNCYYKECSSGIGDFLRGSVFLKQALDQVGLHFDIDFTFHPISSFLKYPSVVQYGKDEIIDVEKESKKHSGVYLQSLRNKTEEVLNSDKDNIFLFTNYSDCIFLDPKEFSKIDATSECKEFFKKRMQFTQEVHDLATKKNIPTKYNIVHFRCGDYELVGNAKGEWQETNNKNYRVKYEECLKIVDNIDNAIVLSDSNALKSFLEDRGCQVLHKKSQHSSYNPGSLKSIKYKDENMLHVCLDMLIMSKAQNIYTHSVYPWFSGFSFWTAKIHNVPIYNNMIGQR